MWNLKNKIYKQIYQNGNRLTDSENKLAITRGERGVRMGEIGERD